MKSTKVVNLYMSMITISLNEKKTRNTCECDEFIELIDICVDLSTQILKSLDQITSNDAEVLYNLQKKREKEIIPEHNVDKVIESFEQIIKLSKKMIVLSFDLIDKKTEDLYIKLISTLPQVAGQASKLIGCLCTILYTTGDYVMDQYISKSVKSSVMAAECNCLVAKKLKM